MTTIRRAAALHKAAAAFLAFIVLSAGTATGTGKNGMLILCLGDSITAGGYPGALASKLERAGIEARVINAGMPGYTAGQYADFLGRFELFRAVSPDIVLLQVGTNNARAASLAERFAGDLRRLVLALGDELYPDRPPRIIIALVPPVFLPPRQGRNWPERIASVNEAIRQAAREFSLDLVDNYTPFREQPDLLIDGVHPGPEGDRVLAANWLAAVRHPAEPEAGRTGLVYDERCLRHDPGEGHPENPARLRAIIGHLEESGLMSRLVPLRARAATVREIAKIHCPAYIEEVRAAALSGQRYLHSPDTGLSRGSWEAARVAAGGVLAAIDAVAEGLVSNAFCAVRPPGHHALRDRAMGFCLFNNVAIGARYAREKHRLRRVLIVDWDVHHGNGTEAAFYDDPGVLFFSVHQRGIYPGTGREEERGAGAGRGFNLNAPLEAGSGIEEYRSVFRDVLEPAARSFRPDLVIISAGFDSRLNDPLGGMKLTPGDFAEMTAMVLAIAEEAGHGRVVSVLEGGYGGADLAEAVAAHVAALAAGAEKTPGTGK